MPDAPGLYQSMHPPCQLQDGHKQGNKVHYFKLPAGGEVRLKAAEPAHLAVIDHNSVVPLQSNTYL